ncbi:MAG: ABC transporter substrate-binding protein [Armatimonadetes bacterium]|nr:ABC transporter substrate-binding protein [Armatimonadota bacterium]
MTFTVAHSPDADDAFMFYALAHRKVDTGDRRYEHELNDIETLNRWALEGRYEVTAVSIHAYAYLADKYALLSAGASMGEANYGPRLVARRPMTLDEVKGVTVAVPGTLTSAYLVLKLFAPDVETVVMPFDTIPEAVATGQVEAGVLIHEAQLTYAEQALTLVLDFGKWWYDRHQLPLPLGGNVVRRDLGDELIAHIGADLKASIQYALAHRDEALDYALGFSGGLDRGRGDEFVGMYVNDRTVDYGDEGREAVRRLLAEGAERGIIPHAVTPHFVG